jgi:transcriptional regulator with GAF, ATPase, and Fis domain
MNRPLSVNHNSFDLIEAANRSNHRPTPILVAEASKARLGVLGLSEARLSSLKVLVTTLLGQIENLERQVPSEGPSELNLQHEVHQFEAALIRAALAKTGGRQRRAARLLGVKVTTLNTKIKRHKINLENGSVSPIEHQAEPDKANNGY